MSIYKIISLVNYALTVAIGVLLIFAAIFNFIPESLGGIMIAFGVISIVPVVVSIFKKQPVKIIDFAYPFIFAIIGIVLYFSFLDISVLIKLLVLSVLGFCLGMIIYGIYIIFSKKKILKGILLGALGVLLIPNVIVFLTVESYDVAFWITLGAFLVIYNLIYFIIELRTKEEDNEITKLEEIKDDSLENNEAN